MSPGAERIRQFVKRKPREELTALLHHITPEAYPALKRDAAPGVDAVRWREYGIGDRRVLRSTVQNWLPGEESNLH